MPEPATPFSHQPFRLAVLMTCHNRRETTLRCLEALFAQEGLPPKFQMEVFLVDDGSTDGTGDAVRIRYPRVKVLQGDGNLYWAGGMRKAWAASLHINSNVILMLNDDSILVPDALQRLSEFSLRSKGIIVGATIDPTSHQLSYGGLHQPQATRPLLLQHLKLALFPQRCATMNGNVVWIPRHVVQHIGGLNPIFTHGLADWEYGLRASKKGIPIWQAPGWVGHCYGNTTTRLWLVKDISLSKRLKAIQSPKGIPIREWLYYCLKFGGKYSMIEIVSPYFNLIKVHFKNIYKK